MYHPNTLLDCTACSVLVFKQELSWISIMFSISWESQRCKAILFLMAKISCLFILHYGLSFPSQFLMNQINRDEISTLFLTDRFGEVRNVMFSMASMPNQHELNAHFHIPLPIFSYADNYKHHFLRRSEDADASM